MDDFAAQYAEYSDGQLLSLASEGGLREEAKIALQQELRKRQITPHDVRKEKLHRERSELQKKVGSNPFDRFRGTGLAFRGAKYLSNGTDRENHGENKVACYLVDTYSAFRFISCCRKRYEQGFHNIKERKVAMGPGAHRMDASRLGDYSLGMCLAMVEMVGETLEGMKNW